MENTIRILLVDDEEGLRQVCAETLAGLCKSIHIAGNGHQALEFLKDNTVDLVVSDIRMPGMDGMTLLNHMREDHPRIPVIFLTGYGTIENAVECMQLGARDYLLKPFKVEELVRKVKNVLSEDQRAAEDTESSKLAALLRFSSQAPLFCTHSEALENLLDHTAGALDASFAVLFPAETSASSIILGETEDQGNTASTLYKLLQDTPTRKEAKLHALQGFPPESPLSSFSSALSVAVGHNEKHMGQLVLARSSGAPKYTEQDRSILDVFAVHAGSCLSNMESGQRIQQMSTEVITSYVRAVEAKDPYTKGHSERVARFARDLGKAMNLSADDCETLHTAGLLHDIGKIGIPDKILNKPGPLTSDETSTMKTHPTVGGDILSRVQELSSVTPSIYHHHERWDGNGYPSGLAGQNIPLGARIISVVDGFEAMTSDRAYQKARTVREAAGILAANAGQQWDPTIVRQWILLLKQGYLQPKDAN